LERQLGYIYCIENKLSNKKYIGQTVNIYSRKSNHLRALEKNKHPNPLLQRSYNRHTDAFEFRILIRCENNMLNELEVKCIDIFDTMEPNGYNILGGGNNNFRWSEKARKRISIRLKGCIPWNKGKRGYMGANKGSFNSESQKGIKHPRWKGYYYVWDSKKNFVGKFVTYDETVEKTSISRKRIFNALNKNKGYIMNEKSSHYKWYIERKK